MQSTGQTSMQASQPVQLSAKMTANSFGSFLRGFAAVAALAIRNLCGSGAGKPRSISSYRGCGLEEMSLRVGPARLAGPTRSAQAPSARLRRPLAEAVADAAHRLDEVGVTQLAPERLDVNVDGPLQNDLPLADRRVHQLVA